eukprot:g71788.t1
MPKGLFFCCCELDIFASSFLCFSIFSAFFYVVGIVGIWLTMQGSGTNDYGQECDTVTTATLWGLMCARVYCPGGVSYNCIRIQLENSPPELGGTQVTLIIAFCLSMIATFLPCMTWDKKSVISRKSLVVLWSLATIMGICAMSIWADFHRSDGYSGFRHEIWDTKGLGFVACIFGWLCGVVATGALLYDIYTRPEAGEATDMFWFNRCGLELVSESHVLGSSFQVSDQWRYHIYWESVSMKSYASRNLFMTSFAFARVFAPRFNFATFI